MKGAHDIRWRAGQSERRVYGDAGGKAKGKAKAPGCLMEDRICRFARIDLE
jgi:hypothetical protein